MLWLIGIILFLLLILCWLLLSNLVIAFDTRTPKAEIQWGTIGKACIWYEDEWWLKIRILFYQKTIRISDIKSKAGKRKIVDEKKKPKKKFYLKFSLAKLFRLINTFRITEWKLAIDTGDHTRNAQLYPMNFFPSVFRHLYINFSNENYLVLKIKNRPWKMLYALLR
jgi:hypothetical protein